MATIVGESLKATFAQLQAEREKGWPAAQLAANVRQREKLVQRFDPSAVAQIGDQLQNHRLVDANGNSISLDALVATGPAVIVFFRFAGCPACNLALAHYQRTLYPALLEHGIPLVAVTPQIAERIGEIVDSQGLSFTVASDPDGALEREIGILFQPDEQPFPPPPGWIGEVTGTGNWELPQPTVLVLGAGREVRGLIVSPDWLDRPEAEQILALLD